MKTSDIDGPVPSPSGSVVALMGREYLLIVERPEGASSPLQEDAEADTVPTYEPGTTLCFYPL